MRASGRASKSAYNNDETINTEYIPNWRSLSKQDKSKVLKERKRLSIKPRGKAGKTGKDKGAGSNRKDNTIKQLRAQNLKHKRTIKVLQTIDKEVDNDDDSNDDAGDSFRGKAVRKKSKKKD